MSFEQQTPGLLGAVRIDLRRLHATWMELLFPRQRSEHSVLGRWTPDAQPMKLAYRAWSLLGVPLVAFLYPFVLVGFIIRFYTRRINTAVTALGFVGATGVVALLWGGLTVAARFQFSPTGFQAVGAAAVVATVSATLAMVFGKLGGRGVTVLLAYPFAMTAFFLPPVVASFFYQPIYAVIGPFSNEFAILILEWLPAAIETFLRQFTLLTPTGLLGMWAGLAIPTGWLLGLVVTLADVVRPSDESDQHSPA